MIKVSRDDLSKLFVSDLKQIAKDCGIKGYSSMSKNMVIKNLHEYSNQKCVLKHYNNVLEKYLQNPKKSPKTFTQTSKTHISQSSENVLTQINKITLSDLEKLTTEELQKLGETINILSKNITNVALKNQLLSGINKDGYVVDINNKYKTISEIIPELVCVDIHIPVNIYTYNRDDPEIDDFKFGGVDKYNEDLNFLNKFGPFKIIYDIKDFDDYKDDPVDAGDWDDPVKYEGTKYITVYGRNKKVSGVAITSPELSDYFDPLIVIYRSNKIYFYELGFNGGDPENDVENLSPNFVPGETKYVKWNSYDFKFATVLDYDDAVDLDYEFIVIKELNI